jgi:hypothetical protein
MAPNAFIEVSGTQAQDLAYRPAYPPGEATGPGDQVSPVVHVPYMSRSGYG